MDAPPGEWHGPLLFGPGIQALSRSPHDILWIQHTFLGTDDHWVLVILYEMSGRLSLKSKTYGASKFELSSSGFLIALPTH